MKRIVRVGFVGACLLSLSISGCGGGLASGLVVIPPAVEKAKAPEGKWKGIHAIYLYDVGYVSYDPIDVGIAEYPSYAYSHFAKIKLLTRAATEGAMYGNIPIRHMDELYKIDAKVIKPDGTEHKLTKSDYVTTVLVKDVVPDRNPPIDFYETQIVFPGLNPGDIIQYSYTARSATLTWNFNHVGAPVLFSKFMVARPQRRVEIQPVIYNRHQLDIVKSEDSGMATGMAGYLSIGGVSHQATYDIWTATNIPPITDEVARPPVVDLASRVREWQGDRRWDWSTLGNTYYKWFSHYGRYPGKAKGLAEKVIKGISDPRERSKAIHDWVKKTLNIEPLNQLTAVPRTVEIETIDIDKLMEEKNAPPEKVANLMWLMMQSVGVDATVVLASEMDSPPAIEDLPSIYQFTHPLLALPDGTLIDTTNRLCPFGMVPWVFEGRKALWIKEGSVAFKDIPASSSEANRREIKAQGVIDPDGSAKIEVDFEMTGQMALAWRKLLAPMKPKERQDFIRDVATVTAGKAEVDEFTFDNLDDIDKPVGLELKYHVPGYADVLRDKLVFKAGAFIHFTACPVLKDSLGADIYICPKPITETRDNPVEFPFRRYDEMNIKVSFPKGFLLQALPKGFRTRQIEKGTSLGVQTSYGSDGGKDLVVLRKFSVNDPFVDLKGYPPLRDMIRRYEAQKDTLITLELPKMD